MTKARDDGTARDMPAPFACLPRCASSSQRNWLRYQANARRQRQNGLGPPLSLQPAIQRMRGGSLVLPHNQELSLSWRFAHSIFPITYPPQRRTKAGATINVRTIMPKPPGTLGPMRRLARTQSGNRRGCRPPSYPVQRPYGLLPAPSLLLPFQSFAVSLFR